jgi:hypothetical protein
MPKEFLNIALVICAVVLAAYQLILAVHGTGTNSYMTLQSVVEIQ